MSDRIRTRSWWGWGNEEDALTSDQSEGLADALRHRFERDDLVVRPAPSLGDIAITPSRLTPPEPLRPLMSDDRRDRALHTYGRSYRDVVRGFGGDFSGAPDLVAHPAGESDVVAVLDWCTSAGIVVVPFGGGSSVVGGVEGGRQPEPWISLDLTSLSGVIEIDRTSRAARIEAGILGPGLEDRLRPHGLTLRHFPQSFEFSTLGGWLATRSGGHYATVRTHIDDFVESMRVVTPSGIAESARLPGSGAGPSPDRLFLGSEGILGVITEAWMRLADRPQWKSSAAVHFEDYTSAVDATRAVSQSGLDPTNCRLLDSTEAMLSAGVASGAHLLIVGFESADHPVDRPIERAVEIARDHGGTVPDAIAVTGPDDATAAAGRDGAVGAWRNAFIRAPYARDAMVAMSVIAETFETATTWDRFGDLHAAVTTEAQKGLADICGGGWITCRFTHVYPDGPAPYFSILAPARPGSEVAMWDEVKAAVSEVLSAQGATITHHHAVGRDHRPWYDRQRPDLFARALTAAKSTLDPAGILNPGVVIDPAQPAP